MRKKDEIELKEYDIEPLYGQVTKIVDSARLNAFKQVNFLQILTNLLIGKRIVEDEQQGNVRAKYGKSILKKLSVKLTEKYGRGFSVDNLENMRKFYLKFGDRISESVLRKLENAKSESMLRILGQEEVPYKLTWTHYLIVGENGEIRKSVFYDNVRDYQGENDVNNEIAETIKNESEKFVLLNNGVTIICKQLSNLRDKFTLTDYQIVNGCQTSHVLYYNKPKAGTVMQIPVKIIETEDEETVNSIIKATNRQTEVTDEQLIALGEFHRKLEAFYNTYTGNQRLYYERRSKQYNSVADIEKVRIISISTQIKAAASMFFDKPHLASRYYGRLLRSVEGIFSKEHKLLPYYTCSYLLYRLEYLFRNKMLPAQYRKYRYHMLMLIKYDFCKGKMPELNANKMESICNEILQCANDNTALIQEISKLIKIIDKTVSDLTNQEHTKTATLVDTLRREIRGNN